MMIRCAVMTLAALVTIGAPAAAGRRIHGFHAHAGGGFRHAGFDREQCRWRRIDGVRQRICG